MMISKKNYKKIEDKMLAFQNGEVLEHEATKLTQTLLLLLALTKREIALKHSLNILAGDLLSDYQTFKNWIEEILCTVE